MDLSGEFPTKQVATSHYLILPNTVTSLNNTANIPIKNYNRYPSLARRGAFFVSPKKDFVFCHCKLPSLMQYQNTPVAKIAECISPICTIL